MFENYRRYQRYAISARAVIKRSAVESQEGLTAQINTVSQGGMGFYTDVFMEKATPVSIELLFGACLDMEKNILEGRIASVSFQEKNYFVGISFEREISYDRFIEMIG